MTQPDQQAFNTDSMPDPTTPTKKSPLGFLNRMPKPFLYGSLALGLFGGIAAWYLVFGNPTTEQVVDTPSLTQTPTTPVTPDTTSSTPNPATTPSVVDPNSNLSRALEVQDIPFLVTTEGSSNSGKTPTNTEIATPSGSGNGSSAGLNPFAPIPTPPVQTISEPIQQASPPNTIASNPPTISVQIPQNLNRTPIPSPQIKNSAPTIILKQPTPLPTPTIPVKKPQSLSNNTKANNTKPTTTTQTKPVKPNTPVVKPPTTPSEPVVKPPTTPSEPVVKPPTTPPEPVVITTRPDIRVPNSTSTANLPIAGGGGVLPVAPQIIQKVNPPQVPQIPIVQPQVQPTKPLELPNEGGVITPDTTSTSGGLKPSSGNNNSGQVDPLNTTITPVKPQTPVVVPVTPPVVVVVTPVEPTRSILNEFITERQLRYLDYVGGPFPQARLEIKGKSVIVGLGETIPDSKVVVKSITASELVLLLGEETLTIPRTEK
jgi:hypothetical protein